jgi:hypothetical protein
MRSEAIKALTDFCAMYVEDRATYSVALPSGLVGKLTGTEQIHLTRLLERRAHLRARLQAAPAFNPYDQSEAQALEWAIRKIEKLTLRLDVPVPPPVAINDQQPAAKPFIPPASIEEGERLREELAATAQQMSEKGGQSKYHEIGAQLRELKAWLHTQHQLRGVRLTAQRQSREVRLTGKAFRLLSEAIAADGEDTLIALFGDAKGIRQAFHQTAREWLEKEETENQKQ